MISSGCWNLYFRRSECSPVPPRPKSALGQLRPFPAQSSCSAWETIKNYLQSYICQEQMVSLLIWSLKNDILKSRNFDNLLKIFVKSASGPRCLPTLCLQGSHPADTDCGWTPLGEQRTRQPRQPHPPPRSTNGSEQDTAGPESSSERRVHGVVGKAGNATCHLRPLDTGRLSDMPKTFTNPATQFSRKHFPNIFYFWFLHVLVISLDFYMF